MRARLEPVDRDRYAVLKGMLEERRREIHDKLRSLRESLPAEAAEVRDAEEHSVDDFVREVDYALMQMKSDTLARIDEAIQRLEHGTYGACGECGAPISAARLRALPFALLCRSCQERVERQMESDRAVRGAVNLFDGAHLDAR